MRAVTWICLPSARSDANVRNIEYRDSRDCTCKRDPKSSVTIVRWPIDPQASRLILRNGDALVGGGHAPHGAAIDDAVNLVAR